MRTKRKPVRTIQLPDSKIRKISGKYSKTAAKNVMQFRFSRKPDKQLLRRTIQASTGRALDHLMISDKKTRMIVNREMQRLISEETVYSEKMIADSAIKSILGEKATIFFNAFEQIFYHNRDIIEYLSQQMAEGEIGHKTKMN